jgi:ribonucleoside-diphosphate reductase alpha chain
MLNHEPRSSRKSPSSIPPSNPEPGVTERDKTGRDPQAAAGDAARPRLGLPVPRRFTSAGVHPFDEIDWEIRSAQITNERGELVFEQTDVEVPKFWSQMATNIVVSKYFRGTIGTQERENSVRQLIGRVAGTIGRWGRENGYFATPEDAEAFEAELTHLLLHQKVSFNSPVWFNVGIEPHPQGSACFINSVQDTMQSILELAKTEGMLFKYGSGTGSNLSTIRSSRELLAGGGTASGPVSFMKGYDAFAGVIKSGGKTRRAAKMVILNVWHPDILDFIWSKADEEKKAHALIEAGYDAGFNVQGGAYDSVFFQNANHSVRVDDEFMKSAVEDREWTTRAVTDGRPMGTYRARDVMRAIAEAAWQCGDPGMQFDTTINDWHPCSSSGRINASNPCSEYMFLDDTACNLASLNLMKFRRADGEFDVDAFRHAVRITILGQEIIVDNASYPTPAITRNSREFRPLGLGYANLGAFLMSRGVPYDSETGRATAAAITALMCGEAYAESARIAGAMGPFEGYEKNREPFARVMEKHRAAAEAIPDDLVSPELLGAARRAWAEVVEEGSKHGFKNGQATVLAPTGTIAFMMDCDTTGIEPDISLIKYKKLVGGGMLKIVNNTVPLSLRQLGYSREQIQEICDYINEHETIEGAPHLREDHLPVFDCAFKPRSGKRSIHYSGHVRMMSAVQPFLSGAISKTVNLPEEATVEDIEQAYIDGWRGGLKAIAIYRDGCKKSQPLSTGTAKKRGAAAARQEPGAGAGPEASAAAAPAARPFRRRLPDEREAITHKFSVGGHEGYITVGMFEDGQPGEIFVTMAKTGSVVSGLMDSFATAISMTLQYGVPLRVLCDKFSHTRFEPSGITNNAEIRFAKSIIDYIFRWLALKFLPKEDSARYTTSAAYAASTLEGNGLTDEAAAASLTPRNGGRPEPASGPAPAAPESAARGSAHIEAEEKRVYAAQADAPPCHECGEIMIRNGSCYACINCGATSGCS